MAQPLARIGIFEVEVQPQASLLRHPGVDFAPVESNRATRGVQQQGVAQALLRREISQCTGRSSIYPFRTLLTPIVRPSYWLKLSRVYITVHLDSATTCVKPCHRIFRKDNRRNRSERPKQTFNAIVYQCARHIADVQFGGRCCCRGSRFPWEATSRSGRHPECRLPGLTVGQRFVGFHSGTS